MTLVMMERENADERGAGHWNPSGPDSRRRITKREPQEARDEQPCDNEPAIEALAREVAQAHQEASQTVPERPPVG